MCRAEYDRGLTMSEDEPLELAGERDFISGIYNYCDRWCEKCPFTARCRVYATEAADGDLDDPEVHDINNEKFWRKLESIFREAHEKIAAWAAEDEEDDFDAAPDFAQEDGNGSAKIALIAIDRSMAAWHAMDMCLPAKSDSIAPILAELERLRWLLEEEFPDARGFIRPGFDEADTELVN